MELPVDPRLTNFNAFTVTRLDAQAHVSRVPNDPVAPKTRRPPARTVRLTLGSKHHRDAPLVSCLMLTRDRPRQAQIAVRLYRRQTWPNRELVIIDSSADQALAEWVESAGDRTIRFIRHDDRGATLGELRNRSVAEAAGQYVCQWDDDDLHHPARIEAEIGALKATGSNACFLSRELIWFPKRSRIGISESRAQEGTLMCEKAVMPPYPALRRGEDSPVMEAILDGQPFVALDLPELYVYVVHGTNTWDDGHMERFWRQCSQRFEGEAYRALLRQISGVYPVREYHEAIAEQQAGQPSGEGNTAPDLPTTVARTGSAA